MYIYIILVAPCFKNILRLEAGYPALRCHNLEEAHPSNLKKYRRGLVSSELLTEVIFLLETKGQQPASSFRAACGPRTSCTRSSSSRVKGTRRRRLSHLQQLAAGGPAARAAPAAVR